MGDSLNDAFRCAKTVSGTTFRRLELKVQWQPWQPLNWYAPSGVKLLNKCLLKAAENIKKQCFSTWNAVISPRQEQEPINPGFSSDASANAGTSTSTSTRALISPWKQAWRKHKRKCKHKQEVQLFFLCFRLSLHLLALRKNGAEQKLTPSIRFVQRKALIPDSAHSAGFHRPLKWQSVGARSLTKGFQKWYTTTASCLTFSVAFVLNTKAR